MERHKRQMSSGITRETDKIMEGKWNVLPEDNFCTRKAGGENQVTDIDGTVGRNEGSVSNRSGSIRHGIGIAAEWLYTMLVVVIGWVLFSLVDLKSFVSYLAVMFGANAGQFYAYGIRYYLSNQMIFYLTVAILACIPWKNVIKCVCPVLYDKVFAAPCTAVYALKRFLLLVLLVFCFIFIINSSYNPFIYFRF